MATLLEDQGATMRAGRRGTLDFSKLRFSASLR